MGRILKVGCVGTSNIMNMIVDSLQQTEGFDVQVICSRSEERAKQFAEKTGVPGYSGSFSEMLKNPDLDVIYLATPNFIHAAQAIEAMEAGKHVIVEKPSGVAEAEVLRMHEAAVRNHVFFLEAITTLFMPNYRKMKELLPKAGKLNEVTLSYGHCSSKYAEYLRGENPNIFNPEMKTGALNDMGIYCIHVAVDLFGEPEDVEYTALHGLNHVDLEGVLKLKYPDLTVTVTAAKNRDLEGGSGCTFTGENGILRQNGPVNAFPGCSARLGEEELIISEQGNENRMLYEHSAFRDCILAGDQAFFEQMTRQSRICAKILEQAHQKEKERIA